MQFGVLISVITSDKTNIANKSKCSESKGYRGSASCNVGLCDSPYVTS